MVDKLEMARLVGFSYPQGNWISPSGIIFPSKEISEQHSQTLSRCLEVTCPPNDLKWKNIQIEFGFVRVLFEDTYALFQTSMKYIDEVWDSKLKNYRKMFHIIQRLPDTKVHIVSRWFYIIGQSKDIVHRKMDSLQMTSGVKHGQPK